MNTSAKSRRISVSVLATESASLLEATLSNVCGAADEVVVVDATGTEETRRVARKADARVVSHPWSDDFSSARNAGWQAATGDWLLCLDAGEQLPDAAALRELVQSRAYDRFAYALPVRVPARGPSSTDEQIAQLRLFPRNRQITFTGRIRESATASFAASGLHPDSASVIIARGPWEHDPQRKAEIARRNASLAEMDLREDVSRPALLNCLGESLQTLGQNSKSRDCYHRALMTSSRGSADMLEAYYGLITSIEDRPQNRATQIAVCSKALEVFPLDAQLLCALGQFLQTDGRLEMASRAYRTAVEHGQVNPMVWHVPEVRDVASICLSLCLQKQGQTQEAATVLRSAIAGNPESERIRRHLIDFHIQSGSADAATAEISNLSVDERQRNLLHQVARGAVMAAGKEWTGAASVLEAAFASGMRDPLCMKWLSVVRLQRGEFAAARSVLQDWQTADPTNAEITRLLNLTTAGETDLSAA